MGREQHLVKKSVPVHCRRLLPPVALGLCLNHRVPGAEQALGFILLAGHPRKVEHHAQRCKVGAFGSRPVVCLCSPGSVYLEKHALRAIILGPGQQRARGLENLHREPVFLFMCSCILLPGLPGLQLHLLSPRKDFLFCCRSQYACRKGIWACWRHSERLQSASPVFCLGSSGSSGICQNALVETQGSFCFSPSFRWILGRVQFFLDFLVVKNTFFLASLGLPAHSQCKYRRQNLASGNFQCSWSI